MALRLKGLGEEPRARDSCGMAANPFLSLFSSPEAAQRCSDVRERHAQEVSDLLMRIFLFSASPSK